MCIYMIFHVCKEHYHDRYISQDIFKMHTPKGTNTAFLTPQRYAAQARHNPSLPNPPPPPRYGLILGCVLIDCIQE